MSQLSPRSTTSPRSLAAAIVALIALVPACLEGGTRVGEPSGLGGLGVAPHDAIWSADVAVAADTADTASPADTARPDTSVGVRDATVDAVTPECTADGALRCEGPVAQQCRAGRWVAREVCDARSVCVDGRCQCAPQCGGRDCGPDGCGGSCGACTPGEVCGAGHCACMPQCSNRDCGGDGCGGSCGTCGPDEACQQGRCQCVPQCNNVECGPDGCGGSCGYCPAGVACGTDGTCGSLGQNYRAIYVEDRWDGACGPGSAPGADIDAVALFSAAGAPIGRFTQVAGQAGGGGCPNGHPNPAAARGPAQGVAGGDFFALAGGWVIGRFGQGGVVQPGMRVVVYELDDPSVGGTGDRFAVYLATHMACGNRPDKHATCLVPLVEDAVGTVELTVPGGF